MTPISIEGHTFLPWLLGREPLVFDLGMNAGRFARAMLERFNARIIGAEPNGVLYEALPSSSRVVAHKVALGGADGTAELRHFNGYDASLCDIGQKHVSSETVAVVSASSFWKHAAGEEISLVKSDIEGAELALFENAHVEDLLRSRQITIEFHDFLMPETTPRVERLKKKIIDAGFHQIQFSRTNGDILFVRRDLISPATVAFLRGPWKYGSGAARVIKRHIRAA